MDILNTFKINGSALTAQTIRLNTISSNMANVETTSTPEGGPYKKKSVVFESRPLPFQQQLEGEIQNGLQGVAVTKIVEDQTPPRQVYKPSHPDADENGYVSMPNVSVMEEMVDMMSATRSYQANVTTIKMAKRMALKALEIGR
jgi:flagellar basal-body rod protein FlgC